MNKSDVRIELRPSGIHRGGVGIFAVRDIEEGEKVAEGLTESDFDNVTSWRVLDRCDSEVVRKIQSFCVGTPEGFIPPPDLDFNTLSLDWYLNHSCDGNCGFDDEGDFIAIRHITKGEELSYDYGLVESNPDFRMLCTCGSTVCRHTITGDDWKDPAFQPRHLDHMHPHLRRLVLVGA